MAERFSILILCLVLLPSARPTSAQERTLEYSRDIAPILADHCFQCHGADKESRDGGVGLRALAKTLRATDQELVFRVKISTTRPPQQRGNRSRESRFSRPTSTNAPKNPNQQAITAKIGKQTPYDSCSR
jgi:hypothetical protein